jgi:hypothetical protein
LRGLATPKSSAGLPDEREWGSPWLRGFNAGGRRGGPGGGGVLGGAPVRSNFQRDRGARNHGVAVAAVV